MNGRQAKKLRKLVREKITEDMTNYFNNIPRLRKKPKLVPKIIWKFFYWVVFENSKAKKIDGDIKK